MDTAQLTVSNDFSRTPVHFFLQSNECYRCPLEERGLIEPQMNDSFKVDTRWTNNFSIVLNSTKNQTVFCQRNFHFRGGVSYVLYVSPPNDTSSSSLFKFWSPNCHLVYMEPERDCNIPIYVAVGVLLFVSILGLLYSLIKKTNAYKRLLNIDQALSEDLGDANGTAPTIGNSESISNSATHLMRSVQPVRMPNRLKSLDAFRGLSLTLMIFVNYGGGGYWFFRHSLWNGLTVADLVFPWFIFIMGTAIAIVFKNVHSRPMPKTYFLWRVLRRALTLFALGIFLNSANIEGDLSKLRIPGVLQRFAITYLVTASCEIICSRPLRSPRFSSVIDQIYLIPLWVINLCFVAIWCSLTFGFYVPDCGRGYIGPGGIQDNGIWRNCSGGAAGYFDWWVFGVHRYQRPTFRKMYQTSAAYDPEGILGSLTSMVLCFLGLMAGKILILMPNWKAISRRLMLWAVIFGAVTLILTKASTNEGFIPINKNLWSLSYILATGSMAFALLLFFYILIDITHIWSGEPFIYPGMNSILIYVCHEVFHHYFPISWTVSETHASLLAMDIWGTSFWVIVSYILYRNRIFVSV